MDFQNQSIELSSEELDAVAGGAVDFANLFNDNSFKNEKLVVSQFGATGKDGSFGFNTLAKEETKSGSTQNITLADFS